MKKDKVLRCKRCILPDTFPGISFSTFGICNYCIEAGTTEEIIAQKNLLEVSIDNFFTQLPRSENYDCVVALSGGKDSSFTLKFLVEKYDVNCLAVLVDNGFISDQALANCHNVTETLKTDFQIFKPAPAFMKNMYRESIKSKSIHVPSAIKRASDICNSCINLINNHMLKIAFQNCCRVIAGGYIGGQVPRNSAMIDFNLINFKKSGVGQRKRYIQMFGRNSNKYFSLPNNIMGDVKVSIINPMLSIHLPETEIIAQLNTIGWKKSLDTGKNSSNCLLNDLGVLMHHKKYEFHPYIFEIAEQTRSGTISRSKAIEKIEGILSLKNFSNQIQQLGLTIEELS